MIYKKICTWGPKCAVSSPCGCPFCGAGSCQRSLSVSRVGKANIVERRFSWFWRWKLSVSDRWLGIAHRQMVEVRPAIHIDGSYQYPRRKKALSSLGNHCYTELIEQKNDIPILKTQMGLKTPVRRPGVDVRWRQLLFIVDVPVHTCNL